MSSKIMYSVVVPVYNSEKSLPELCKRLGIVFQKLKQTYEIILVDDCSKDNSWNVMKEIHRNDKHVKIIQLMKNFSQNNALMCGFNHAQGEYIITMDDDLQNPPEELPKMISKIKKGYDVVHALYKKRKHRLFQNIASRIIKTLFAKVIGIKFNVSSFRIINKKTIKEVIKSKNYCINVNVLLANVSNRAGACYVQHHKRKFGRTNYSIVKLIRYALNMIFNFTIFPLRLATLLGLFFSGVSIILAGYYFIQYYFNNITVSGFTSLILSITFFSGVILFIMGVIGEYIGRIFLILNQKPQYVIRHKR